MEIYKCIWEQRIPADDHKGYYLLKHGSIWIKDQEDPDGIIFKNKEDQDRYVRIPKKFVKSIMEKQS